MRLVDVICSSVILALFSSVFAGLFSQIVRIDRELDEIRKKTDSTIFITESFYNSCKGKGFSSFDEWKGTCADMWKLESIECECIGGAESGLYCGKWKGPYGSGEVYGKCDKEK